MQFRSLPALLVFTGSYFPLALILALQDLSESTWNAGICKSWNECHMPSFNHPWLCLFGVLITGACLCLTLKVLSVARFKYPLQVLESKPVPGELISYVFPYVIAFMGFDYESQSKIAGLVAFLFLLFLITYKSKLIIMNPLLIVFGWNLYEAKISEKERVWGIKVLSKASLPPGRYMCDQIGGIYITKGKNDD